MKKTYKVSKLNNVINYEGELKYIRLCGDIKSKNIMDVFKLVDINGVQYEPKIFDPAPRKDDTWRTTYIWPIKDETSPMGHKITFDLKELANDEYLEITLGNEL